ncbi:MULTISPECIES: hypothetical protein [Streptomyces]|uniref:hypothetical protein n=1 Tax=Streptomyces TaxID=1883 RepID=UPI0036600E38
MHEQGAYRDSGYNGRFPGGRRATQALRDANDLFEALKGKIEAGDEGFKKGQRFISKPRLMAEYSISRHAANVIYERLISERYVAPMTPGNLRSDYKVN